MDAGGQCAASLTLIGIYGNYPTVVPAIYSSFSGLTVFTSGRFE